jgi:hypothetical protein
MSAHGPQAKVPTDVKRVRLLTNYGYPGSRLWGGSNRHRGLASGSPEQARDLAVAAAVIVAMANDVLAIDANNVNGAHLIFAMQSIPARQRCRAFFV